MVFVVPFDGSDLATAALARAVEFDAVLDEGILAVSAVPKGNETYARNHGWLDSADSFEMDADLSSLREQVVEVAPDAEFRHVVVGHYAPSGTIASRIRTVAREADTSMLVVGSDNAGRIVSSISSVGSPVSAEDLYDVVIVRNRKPSKVDTIRNSSATETDSEASAD